MTLQHMTIGDIRTSINEEGIPARNKGLIARMTLYMALSRVVHKNSILLTHKLTEDDYSYYTPPTQVITELKRLEDIYGVILAKSDQH